jgi:Stage II sporulation protein E (SpoIIE)
VLDIDGQAAWAHVLARVIDSAHLAAADGLAAMLDEALRDVGLTADVLVSDAPQRVLTSMRIGAERRLDLANSLAGRAYQLGEILKGADAATGVAIWVPMIDGTDRLGVVQVGFLDPERRWTEADDAELKPWLWTLAGLMGHIVATKFVYSDRLRRWRSNGPLTAASELLWQLLPPRTFATERIVVSAVLEPTEQVAGDAFDYNLDGDIVDLSVFDAVGHDLRASVTTALAITAVRNARRSGERDLAVIAGFADELIASQTGPTQFATAVLARLDTRTGVLDYLNAGHPPPLLIRDNKVVKELAAPPRFPLGVTLAAGSPAQVAREQLEPADRILMYSDGIVEARDGHGEFFGEERLVEMAEHAAADRLSAPETLRRLIEAVFRHQDGRLQDDATLLLVDWSPDAFQGLLPTLPPTG